MFTAEQYRAKAAEFNAFLANTPRSPNETSEFRNLAQTHTTLADNEEWMAVHLDRTVQPRKHGDDGAALAEVEEQILRCLGAAVIMRWNTVPTKLQKELFDCASSIGNLQQEIPLKGQIARRAMTRPMVAASRGDEDDTLQEIHRKDGTKVLVAS
jgi:hypothetical protein